MGEPEVRHSRSEIITCTDNRSRDVEDIWKDHFDYFYREYGQSIAGVMGIIFQLTNTVLDEFIFPMTIHPDVSGRPHVLLMHERIIEHINKHEGVEWVTMAEVSCI
jgi:peptidoglycan/xylan/chitin deacetylase (PgdA/CDA1 family)